MSIDEARAIAGFIEGLPDAALVLDEYSSVIAANRSAQAMAPITPRRHVSQWSRSPELANAIEAARNTGKQQKIVIRWFTPVGRTLDTLITPVPYLTAANRAALLVVLRDLTEQEQLAKLRVDFVANASHELRTPLASLRGFIETLQGAARDDAAARQRFLVIMEEQATRMSRLIEDLLSLSRIEMREHVVPTEPVDVALIVAEVAKTMAAVATDAGIELRVGPTVQPRIVLGDRDELAQVVQNLIQNAIKYGRRGGFVEVGIAARDRSIEVSVVDDGMGIAAEHLPRLTERFYRVSAKVSRERGGTGLGLAIVKHIVNRHRGELRIASVIDKGSSFTVTLPAAS